MKKTLTTKQWLYKYGRRLLKLAKFLEKVPEKRFDFGIFVGPDWKGISDLSCGTSACALGWATTVPQFRKLGLRLKVGGSYNHFTGDAQGYVCMKDTAYPNFDDSMRAASKIFGLSNDEALFLFVPSAYLYSLNNTQFFKAPDDFASAKKVAKHIKKFVKLKKDGVL